MNLILTFPSTHAALKCEKILREKNIPIEVIPIPRYLSADCGIALRFPSNFKQQVENIIQTLRLDFKEIHEEKTS
jgi:hypothetical protein